MVISQIPFPLPLVSYSSSLYFLCPLSSLTFCSATQESSLVLQRRALLTKSIHAFSRVLFTIISLNCSESPFILRALKQSKPAEEENCKEHRRQWVQAVRDRPSTKQICCTCSSGSTLQWIKGVWVPTIPKEVQSFLILTSMQYCHQRLWSEHRLLFCFFVCLNEWHTSLKGPRSLEQRNFLKHTFGHLNHDSNTEDSHGSDFYFFQLL